MGPCRRGIALGAVLLFASMQLSHSVVDLSSAARVEGTADLEDRAVSMLETSQEPEAAVKEGGDADAEEEEAEAEAAEKEPDDQPEEAAKKEGAEEREPEPSEVPDAEEAAKKAEQEAEQENAKEAAKDSAKTSDEAAAKEMTDEEAVEQEKQSTVKEQVKKGREEREADEAAELLTQAANVKGEDAAAANANLTNLTAKVVKQKLEKWKEGISTLKSQLKQASQKTEKAKEEAKAAMDADESVKMDAKMEQKEQARNVTKAEEEVDAELKRNPADEETLKKEAAKAEATKDDVKVGQANIESLLKAKTAADEKYAKAKIKHALEGEDEMPKDGGKPTGLLKTLSEAAKAKNIADLRYQKATEKLKAAEDEASKAVAALKNDTASPTLTAVEDAQQAEEKAIQLEGKANKARLKALKAVSDADAKAQEKLKRQEELSRQVTKIKAKAERDVFEVQQAQERTQKMKAEASEKESKADALKGLRKRADAQLDAEEDDFNLETMANKIRAERANAEAGQKKTEVAKHTLTVLKNIDKAAQKEAKLMGDYRAKENAEKSKAGKLASVGSQKLKRERKALQKLTNDAISNNNA